MIDHSPQRSGPPALVAGGGIGGLSAALALVQQGFSVTVLERASALGEIGAGIQLGPNVFRAFDRLGVGRTVRDMAVFVERMQMIDAVSAEEIANIDLGEAFQARFGGPYAVVHRGDLHGVLLQACRDNPAISIHVRSEVTGYEQDAGGVTAVLGSGERVTGALLIGADGLWSNVRAQLVGDGPPRVSGHTTYRSVIPAEDMPPALRWNAMVIWVGPKRHIVHYPLQGGTAFNLVATINNDAPEAEAGTPTADETVREAFAPLHPKISGLIDHGRNWRRWVLCDREPNGTWTDGRVALLGDAAHPTLQYLAQGACMAVEDAVALSQSLARSPDDIGRALEFYRDARLLRTARVQVESRMMGESIYHPAGVEAQLRNAMMRAMSPEDYHRRMAWLYAPEAGPQ